MDDRSALARRAIALVDLTDLGDQCTADDVDRLCTRAVGPFGSTAAVCIWPPFVAQAVERLTGTGVRVATVVNFPGGGGDTEPVVEMTAAALADGADEVDLVLPYHAFLDGDAARAEAMVVAVRDTVGDRLLKVILESGEYPDLATIGSAARLAIRCGADFVKTSTGKSPTSATIAAAVMILDAIRDADRQVGFKPSGGIRTVDDAARFLAVADEMMSPGWATPGTFRFGASGLLDALESAIAGPSTPSSPSGSATY